MASRGLRSCFFALPGKLLNVCFVIHKSLFLQIFILARNGFKYKLKPPHFCSYATESTEFIYLRFFVADPFEI